MSAVAAWSRLLSSVQAPPAREGGSRAGGDLICFSKRAKKCPLVGLAPFRRNAASRSSLRQHYASTRFEEQRQLHLPQKHMATVPESSPRVETNALQEQADNAKSRNLYWKPLSWLGTIRPSSSNDAFDPNLWATCVLVGLEVQVLSFLPRHHNNPLAKCCKKHYMDFHGDHTSTCIAHSRATKAHDWMVGARGPLCRTAGHMVRTQHGVSAGQRRGNVEIRNYLQDAAGRRSLVFDLSMTHDRFGSSSHVQQNGLPAERFAIASPGPRCALASCCSAQN
jgi:hypothetical protein